MTKEAGGDREVLISGNWKMHHTHFEAIQFVQALASLLRANPLRAGRALSLHPPFTALRSVQTALESDGIPVLLGAQNCHDAEKGAFTGEVSAEMLAKLNVSYVIVGHSERRQYFGETDEVVRAKLDAVFRHGMIPLLCVGETFEQRAAGHAHSQVSSQLEFALRGRDQKAVASLVVAYEPIWAIGSGQTASSEDAEEMATHIRAEIDRLCGTSAAGGARIQYGGSVTPENAGELLRCSNVDGLLVGGASLAAESLYEISRAR
ncbi:MAG: triose-phosphate isomerase [Acidimicrobiales bacterium]